MRDAGDENLFVRFSRVAQRSGVYTPRDYAEIIDDLVRHWNISTLGGLSGLAAKAQEYLCGLADRYRSIADRISTAGADRFSWIFNRELA
jgi:acyl-[acyl-carrier-protein] desaturase